MANDGGHEFGPEDPDLRMAFDASKNILRDPRDFQEATHDVIDQRLTDVLQSFGVVEAQDSGEFSRQDMLDVARAAYFKAVRDSTENPEAIEAIMKAVLKNGPGLKSLAPESED